MHYWPSSIRPRLLACLLIVAGILPGSALALRFDTPMRIPAGWLSHPRDVAIADVNGDGRLDVVSVGTRPGATLAVNLQREDGHLDAPLTADCQCAQGALYAITQDGAARPLILAHANGHFIAYQLQPDNTFSIVQYLDSDMAEINTPQDVTMVDANQDGREDLFYTYDDDTWMNAGLDFRYSLWYQGSGRDKVPGERDATRGGFFRYRSDRFRYSGINNPDNTWTPALAIRVDLDADGYNDAIEGKCPEDCFYKQQPYRQLTARSLAYAPSGPQKPFANAYGDLDGDGLPDLVWTDAGAYNASARIYLQDLPEHFVEVAEFGPLYGASNPVIADMDNDGRNDIVIASMQPDLNSIGWLDVLLQTAPGQFALSSQVLPAVETYTRLQVADLDGNGCRDIVRLRALPKLLASDLDYFRGQDCLPATDLSVRVSGAPGAPTVEVRRLVGDVPTAPRIVRVTLAPAVRDPASVGFAVTAPPACTETPAEAPRRMYDCTLPSLATGGETTFPFSLGLAPDTTVDVQVNAFLLSAAGDINPDNNLFRWKATMSTVTAEGRTP